jgi:glycine cleavage system H protein
VEINTIGETLAANAVFGSVEAVKTVSDLFLPVAGEVVEVNPALDENPGLVNSDPYGEGWLVRVDVKNEADLAGLLSADAYKALVGV